MPKNRKVFETNQNCLEAFNSNSFRFVACINQNDPTCFTDHSILLTYLSEQLLLICNLSRRYEFEIDFSSDKNAGTNFISSLLQMPAIIQCSQFKITLYFTEEELQLPVEAISDWLNHKSNDRLQEDWYPNSTRDIYENIFAWNSKRNRNVRSFDKGSLYFYLIFVAVWNLIWFFKTVSYRVRFILISFLLLKCVCGLLFQLF